MERISGYLAECAASLAQSVLGCALQRFSIFVEEVAKHCNSWNLGKGVNESGAISRHHIQVAATGLDKREQARAVNTFTTCEDSVEIVYIVYHEIQRLKSSIRCRIHEIHHCDAIGHDKFHNVVFSKLFCGLPKISHNLVWVNLDVLVLCHGNKNISIC